jgi:hypothetical protein
MQRVDREVNKRLQESAEQLAGGAVYPLSASNRYESGSKFPDYPENVDRPSTVNPPAEALSFEVVPPVKEDAASITRRFERMSEEDLSAKLRPGQLAGVPVGRGDVSHCCHSTSD